jgi:myo-inositol-1(or 4)-monophosphatase
LLYHGAVLLDQHHVLQQFSKVSLMQNPVITVMVKAARQGGSIILRHMNKLDSLSVFEKSKLDYASEVDSLAEAEIIKELKRAYPNAAFLCEESGAMGKGKQTFVIDPLDGTSNFLHGIPHYCVSIALVENGEPIDAVIYDPIHNEIYTASRGKGALLNDKKIRVADRKDLTGAMLITGFPPRERARLGEQLRFTEHLLASAEDIRRTGSAALDLAYVACGRADGYFESGVKAWDVAAGMLLVREAGGRVCDYKGRGERILDAGQMVAGNMKVGPLLQAAIAQSDYGKSF